LFLQLVSKDKNEISNIIIMKRFMLSHLLFFITNLSFQTAQLIGVCKTPQAALIRQFFFIKSNELF